MPQRASWGTIALGTLMLAVLFTILGGAMFYAIDSWQVYNDRVADCEDLDEVNCVATSVEVQESPAPPPARGVLCRLQVEVEPGQNTTGFTSVVAFVPSEIGVFIRCPEAKRQARPFLASAESGGDVVCHQDPNNQEDIKLDCEEPVITGPIIWTIACVLYAIVLGLFVSYLYRRTSIFVIRPYIPHPMVGSMPLAGDSAGSHPQTVLTEEELKILLEEVDVQDPATCAICLEDYGGPDCSDKTVGLRCNHLFHQTCIKKWLMSQSGKNCPICKEAVSSENVSAQLESVQLESVGAVPGVKREYVLENAERARRNRGNCKLLAQRFPGIKARA
ncbi:hypothetical protein NDN08_004932 [Rhodosorus marinus]|uniref:RING-type domain-containing protein n=1 Tax=Rhodosorus marinus TaxID=101924 RepID=A0AAV8UIU9_9RHOD|nr:hypothetical protein NDN08_004932 [Rhodosorus marinus]